MVQKLCSPKDKVPLKNAVTQSPVGNRHYTSTEETGCFLLIPKIDFYQQVALQVLEPEVGMIYDGWTYANGIITRQ